MTSLLTVKLRRDLRATWPRFLLMVIAIAISLTAFGGVLFAWAASGREASSAYMSTEPASATILLDQAIDAEQMAVIAAEVRKRPGVIEATGRTQFSPPGASSASSRKGRAVVAACTPRPRVSPPPWGSHNE